MTSKRTRRGDGLTPGGVDPWADDWLAAEGRIEWLDELEPERVEPPAPVPFVEDAAAGPDEPHRPSAAEEHLQVIRRRRIVAIAAVAAVVVLAIAIPVVVLGGGGKKATPPPTTRATTTQATTTQQTPTTPTTTPTTTPAATTLTVTLPASGSLRKGDTGDAVKTLQTGLKALGYDVGTPDGDFGAATETAVSAFQQASGLPVDGVVGAATAAKLNAALAAKGAQPR
jgi:hypothetical protein